MDKTEYEKYLDLIASMTIGARMGGITKETYIGNLEAILKNLKEGK